MSYSESQGALHIITPLSIFALQMVDSVVLSGMLAPCHKNYASICILSSDQCFYGLTTEGTGARSIRSRNNIARGGRITHTIKFQNVQQRYTDATSLQSWAR